MNNNNINDLNSHEYVDTFFMTDEQLKNAKRTSKENGTLKELKKFFVGCAVTTLSIGVAGLAALSISNPIISSAVLLGVPVTSAFLTMKSFFKAKRGGDEIRTNIANEYEDDLGGKRK